MQFVGDLPEVVEKAPVRSDLVRALELGARCVEVAFLVKIERALKTLLGFRGRRLLGSLGRRLLGPRRNVGREEKGQEETRRTEVPRHSDHGSS